VVEKYIVTRAPSTLKWETDRNQVLPSKDRDNERVKGSVNHISIIDRMKEDGDKKENACYGWKVTNERTSEWCPKTKGKSHHLPPPTIKKKLILPCDAGSIHV
jgi:hypothetical protein